MIIIVIMIIIIIRIIIIVLIIMVVILMIIINFIHFAVIFIIIIVIIIIIIIMTFEYLRDCFCSFLYLMQQLCICSLVAQIKIKKKYTVQSKLTTIDKMLNCLGQS